jgi:hypothetical protein
VLGMRSQLLQQQQQQLEQQQQVMHVEVSRPAVPLSHAAVHGATSLDSKPAVYVQRS